MDTGSESIEAIIRRSRNPFAGFVARRTRDCRSARCSENWWGARAAWGGGRKIIVDGASPGLSQSFRYQRRPIDYDHIMTAAQEEGEWRKTAEQGAERFMAKWIAAKKARAGLRHVVICLDVTGRTKERVAKASVLVLVRSP